MKKLLLIMISLSLLLLVSCADNPDANGASNNSFSSGEHPEKTKVKHESDKLIVEEFEVTILYDNAFVCKNEKYDNAYAPNWLDFLYQVKVGDIVTITHSGEMFDWDYQNFNHIYEMSIVDENGNVISVKEDEVRYKTTLLVIEKYEKSFIGTEQNVKYPSVLSTPNWFSDKHELKVGDIVHVIHSGGILESYPEQFSHVYEMQLVLPDGSLFIVTEDDLPPKEPYQLKENETLENDMVLSYTNDHYFEDEVFRYEITDFKSVTNDYFEFAITVTNISGKDYKYFGTYNDERVTEAKVFAISDDDELILKHEEIAFTCDEADNQVIKAGDSTKSFFKFDLPSDLSELDAMPLFALMSQFSLEFDYFGKTVIIEDVLTSMSTICVDLSGNKS